MTDNDTAQFKEGDCVIIKKSLGSDGDYFYGSRLRNVPLGTRGVFVERYGPGEGNHYHIRINGRFLCFRSEEFELDRETSEERRRRLDSALETALLTDEPKVMDVRQNGKKQFEPKFNPREEFAMWIRQEFPNLREYASRWGADKALTERREEVMGAARQAYEHAMETTNDCAKAGFIVTFNRLIGQKTRRGNLPYEAVDFPGRGTIEFIPTSEDLDPPEITPELFARNLNGFVEYIEYVSANLNDEWESRHHGTIRR